MGMNKDGSTVMEQDDVALIEEAQVVSLLTLLLTQDHLKNSA